MTFRALSWPAPELREIAAHPVDEIKRMMTLLDQIMRDVRETCLFLGRVEYKYDDLNGEKRCVN